MYASSFITRIPQVTYFVHLSKEIVSLPVIEIYCTSHKNMEELKIGEVTYKNATTFTFTQKEVLERHGISLVSNLTDTVLEIVSDESDLIGAVFELSFSTYVVEEPTWMNTTQIKIIYSKPPCAMT